MRLLLVALLVLAMVGACESRESAPPPVAATRAAAAPAPPVPPPPAPVILDTTAAAWEIWTIPTAPTSSAAVTRRLVERLAADLAAAGGFESASLLANGEGTQLLAVLRWADTVVAAQWRDSVAGWLGAATDTIVLRATFGTTTPQVVVRAVEGTPPILRDGEELFAIARFRVKPGHSFGALATLADSMMVRRVRADTAVSGGATLAARDSGVVYSLLHARAATVVALATEASPPFWAPFARKEESLFAVVATVHQRR